jgi:hypothetical protein
LAQETFEKEFSSSFKLFCARLASKFAYSAYTDFSSGGLEAPLEQVVH